MNSAERRLNKKSRLQSAKEGDKPHSTTYVKALPNGKAAMISATSRLSEDAEKEVWKAIGDVLEKNPDMSIQDAANLVAKELSKKKDSEYSKDRERFEKENVNQSYVNERLNNARKNGMYDMDFVEDTQNYDLPESVAIKEYEKWLITREKAYYEISKGNSQEGNRIFSDYYKDMSERLKKYEP